MTICLCTDVVGNIDIIHLVIMYHYNIAKCVLDVLLLKHKYDP